MGDRGRLPVQAPAFPRVMEDWQLFTGPAVADISGDALPEIVATSGGFFVHAFSAAGVEPPGWPKLAGQWQARRADRAAPQVRPPARQPAAHRAAARA